MYIHMCKKQRGRKRERKRDIEREGGKPYMLREEDERADEKHHHYHYYHHHIPTNSAQ